MNATTRTPNPKALLLDDDPTVLRLLGTALEARGFELRAAADGDAGFALLLDELLDLDVLVLDLDLPGRDGWELLRLVRCAGGERDLRIVVLARDPSPAVRARLLGLGADAVVDRRAGHAVAAKAIASVKRRPVAATPAAARPGWGALLVRAALAPVPRLAATY
jgi:DNA-binding response OmpR family regulator